MIRPTQFDSNGNITVFHDEFQHGGTVHVDNVPFVDGFDLVLLFCPVCNSVSAHPISGGGAPEMVQELFIRKIRRASQAIPNLPDLPPQVNARRPFANVKAYVKARTEALDGPGRFKHDNLTQIQD